MNNNGKASGAFLFLIPVFFVVVLIVMDTIFSYSQNKNYKNITESIIKEVMGNQELEYEEYYDEIKRLYKKKGYSTEFLVVDASSYDVYVENSHNYFGIFSSLKNTKNEGTDIVILGVTFKAKKNSVTSLKVNARFNYDDELEFEYTE